MKEESVRPAIFLPSVNKDSHELCVTCQSQFCSFDLCGNCAFWSADIWSLVHAYIDDLQQQGAGKREGKSESSFSSGFDPDD